MTTKVTMPQLGESVVEGTVGRWLVRQGERVEKDQPLVEILTDKADSELPAPVAGVVVSLAAGVDDVVPVGGVLCEIDEDGVAIDAPDEAEPEAPSATSEGKAAPSSPSVRQLAREHGVDLEAVAGSGDAGRITRADVLAAATPSAAPVEAERSPEAPAQVPTAPAAPAPPAERASAFRLPPYSPRDGDKVIPFTRRRRIIADHMVYSKHVAPEVVTFAECDLARTASLRDAHKGQYKAEGVGLTFLSFAAAATARALREFPALNARMLDDAYVELRHLNLGIAVDTEQGLVVPVIRDADDLTVRGLARAIADIAERARTGDLAPDDLSGKTFTISNPGRQGNLVGGAIISQPNVGILRLGTIKKRVVVVEEGGEDRIVIHPVMYMALTYDHRVVDGARANGFLYRITEILEAGDFEL